MIKEELIALLNSGVPVIAIGSWEEDLVEAYVADAARCTNRQIYIWSAARGFYGDDKPSEKRGDMVFKSAFDALQRLRQVSAPSVALLLDFHPYFNDPGCVRALRELARLAPDHGPQVVLSMPIAQVPTELLKDAAYFNLPLPEARELRDIFNRASSPISASLPADLSERAAVAAAGLTRRQAERVYKFAIETVGVFTPGPTSPLKAEQNPLAYADECLRVILLEKRRLTRGALALEFRESRETFDHIGGLELLKGWLRSRANAFSEKALEFGLPSPRGLLLLGIQGCGKSLTAKAVSDLWKLPLLRLDLSYIGPVAGEEFLMQALRTAEAVAPAVLWVDEIEKGFGKAGEGSSAAIGGVSLRALSAFITWLQEKAAPVYVVATANSIRLMPPELLRKGRFDEIFFINLPSREERREIFRIHIAKRGRNPQNFDIELLAERCEGFSGAEIEATVVAGMFEAFSAGRDLTTEDVLNSIQSTVPLSVTMEDEIKAIRDWAKGRARPASLDTRLADLLHPQPS